MNLADGTTPQFWGVVFLAEMAIIKKQGANERGGMRITKAIPMVISILFFGLLLASCKDDCFCDDDFSIESGNSETVYSDLEFIHDFFQFDPAYVNTYFTIELAEDEMEFYVEESGINRVILGVNIEDEITIKFTDTYDIRYYLVSLPNIETRCDFYELMPIVLQTTISSNEYTGNSSSDYEDTIKIYPPIPEDTQFTHIRVVVKGTLLGKYITDEKPVGAFVDIPIEVFEGQD